MKKELKPDRQFENWIKDKQRETGGLINQPTAGRILGKHYKTINGYITRKKLSVFQYDENEKKWLSLNEVLSIKKE